MSNIILVILAVAVFLTAEGVYYLVVYRGEAQRVELQRRLRHLAGGETLALFREQRLARTPGLATILRAFPMARRIETLLLQTDLTWTVALTLGLSMLFALLLTIVLGFVLRGAAALALVGVPLGAAIPFLIILSNRSARNAKVSAQLPDALDMMVRSLRAGHGVSAAFRLVAQEMPPPIAVEFGRCFEEQNIGVEFRMAVKNMCARVPNNLDLQILAVSVIVQRDTGGNLVEILDQISMTIRERFKFYGKLRALTAEGRMSAIILGALPFVSAIAVGVMNPKYLEPLVEDPLGRIFLGSGVLLWCFGLVWMNRLSKVDY
jgi:tight adherence protein B